MIGESHWTIPVMPVLIILLAVLLVAILVTVAAFMFGEDYIWGGFGVAVIVMVVIGALIAYFPYEPAYHRWYHVTGQVQQIGSRILTTDKSVNQRIVLQIDGQPFGVDDTRASLVKVGDQVDLTCRRDFQFNAESGWVCNWGWNR